CQLESILLQRDAERDAATRIAALESAAEHCLTFAYVHGGIAALGCTCGQKFELDTRKVVAAWQEHLLAIRTQSDLDWLERHDAQVTLKEAEAWFLRAHGLRWEDYCAPASEVSYTYTETFLADYERVAELRKLAQPGEREK